jgi:TatD DNase family protein
MIDIGPNLTDPSFHKDLDTVIENARTNNVKTCIITGTTLKGSKEAIRIVQHYKPSYRMYSTVGIHPHNASSLNEGVLQELRTLCQSEDVLAVGECGLDFNRNYSPQDAQIHCFEKHLQLAEELGKPLFLHERDAFDAFVASLSKFKVHGVVHCFTGNAEQARTYISMGFYIGVTGWITDKRRNSDLIDAMKHIPLDRLLIETDSPYLAPRNSKKRIQRNEPMYLPLVVQKIAEILGISEAEIIEQTTSNACKLFGISVE